MKRSIHAAAWVLLVVAAVVLWPQAWGGTMTYVVTNGTSMQPMFSAGDLAVLRSAGDYDVGDVVAYRSEELNRVVMHRVLTEADGVYTFQGDNNDFVDPDEVAADDVLGRLALRVPKVGLVLGWLLQPVNILLVVGAAYLLLADRKPKEQSSAADAQPVPGPIGISDLRIPDAACVADVVDDADLTRMAAALRRPVLHNESTGESFVQDGAMVYRHRVAVRVAPEIGSGRDWKYGADADVVALRPRRVDAQIDYGIDLGKLLKLG